MSRRILFGVDCMQRTRCKVIALFALIFFAILFPAWSFAQDSRIIDIPNIEGDSSSFALSKSLRELFAEEGHLIYEESEMVQNAQTSGVRDPLYWYNADLIKKVNKKLRHDAVLVGAIGKDKKKTMLEVDIKNAFTGKSVGIVKQKIANKKKLSTKERRAILASANEYFALINPADYPPNVTITVRSQPSGATVTRNGLVIGKTPLVYETEERKSPESWTLSLEGYNDYIQAIDLTKDSQFDLTLGEAVPVVESSDDSVLGSDSIIKVPLGKAQPLFHFGISFDPSIRTLDTTVKEGTGSELDYTTSAYFMTAFDLEFYPLAMAIDNQWAAGVGIFANVGFGFLKHVLSSDSLNEKNAPTCEKTETSNGKTAFRCGTSHVRFEIGALYRILLQTREDGKRDPDGMNLDIQFGYTYNQMQLEDNPSYRGHGYQGILVGLRYGTYLGIRDLRLQGEIDFEGYFGYGTSQMIGTWGESVDSGLGVNFKIDLSYHIWKGLYAKLGYSLTYSSVTYAGRGSQRVGKDTDGKWIPVGPEESHASDMFHEIMIGVGYNVF